MFLRAASNVWEAFKTVAGVAILAAALSSAIFYFASGEDDEPVVITSDFILHTPRVPVGGSFTFSVWRDSSESCPGVGVVSLSPVENLNVVISQRYPLSSPGFKSPPPLTVTRQLPRNVGPGKWRVQTGVDSVCPTRKRFDQTGDFVLEVYDDNQSN